MARGTFGVQFKTKRAPKFQQARTTFRTKRNAEKFIKKVKENSKNPDLSPQLKKETEGLKAEVIRFRTPKEEKQLKRKRGKRIPRKR